jgi:hypothetical protein
METQQETEERLISFIRGNGNVLRTLPLDSYEPGDIKDTKEQLAEEFQCKPEEIEVRITGIRDRMGRGPGVKLKLVDRGAAKPKSKPTPI